MNHNSVIAHVGPCRVDPDIPTNDPHHERTPRRGVRGALGYGLSILLEVWSNLRDWGIDLIGYAKQRLVQVVGIDPCRTSAFFQYALQSHGNQTQGVSDSLFRGHGSLHRGGLLLAGGVDREVTAFDLREAGVVPLEFYLPQDGRVQRVVRRLPVGARPELLFACLFHDRLTGHGFAGVGQYLDRGVEQAEFAGRFCLSLLRRSLGLCRFLRFNFGGFFDGCCSAGLWLSCWCVLRRRFQFASQSVLTRGSFGRGLGCSGRLGFVCHVVRLSHSYLCRIVRALALIAHDHELPRRANDIHSHLPQSDRFTAGFYAREWARKCYLESASAHKNTIKQAYYSPLKLSAQFYHSGPPRLQLRHSKSQVVAPQGFRYFRAMYFARGSPHGGFFVRYG